MFCYIFLDLLRAFQTEHDEDDKEGEGDEINKSTSQNASRKEERQAWEPDAVVKPNDFLTDEGVETAANYHQKGIRKKENKCLHEGRRYLEFMGSNQLND